MRVFLDTNIILDILEHRQPHAPASYAVLDRCELLAFPLHIAWHSISNAFYIFSKKVGAPKAGEALEEVLMVVAVATTGHAEAVRAFNLGFTDLEDALQSAAAEACRADFIVTRNAADFAKSPVSVLTPASFLLRFPVP